MATSVSGIISVETKRPRRAFWSLDLAKGAPDVGRSQFPPLGLTSFRASASDKGDDAEVGGFLLGQIRERTHLDSPERKKLLVGALSTEKMSLTGRISFSSSPRLRDEAENMPLFLPSHPGATLELHSHANVW